MIELKEIPSLGKEDAQESEGGLDEGHGNEPLRTKDDEVDDSKAMVDA